MTRSLAPLAFSVLLLACGPSEPADDVSNLRDDTLRSAEPIEANVAPPAPRKPDTVIVNYGHGHDEDVGEHDSTAEQRHKFHEH